MKAKPRKLSELSKTEQNRLAKLNGMLDELRRGENVQNRRLGTWQTEAEAECKIVMDEYWNICSDYIFFHFTYTSGNPNLSHDVILNNLTGNPFIFDIVEPHKNQQDSITMVRKK